MDDHLLALREAFEHQAGRSLALPVAGLLGWSAVGIIAAPLPQRTATVVLLFCTGTIFPLGLVPAWLLGERLLTNTSALGRR